VIIETFSSLFYHKYFLEAFLEYFMIFNRFALPFQPIFHFHKQALMKKIFLHYQATTLEK
jgi:hypothetical protein